MRVRWRIKRKHRQHHQQVDCEVSDSLDKIFKTVPWRFPVSSAPMQIMIKPKHDQTHGRRESSLAGTGPPPGCSALALVSTWLCPLSASQRTAEWGSIETNSLCRTQLMGLPGPGRRGAPTGLWLLILPHKHAWNLPPGICPVTITNPAPSKPTSLSVHTWIHPKIPRPIHPPRQAGWVTGEWLVVVHSLVTHNGPEAEKKRSGVACSCREMYWSIF